MHFVVRDCNLIERVSICSFLPGCTSCFVSENANSDFFSRSFLSIDLIDLNRESETKNSKRIAFYQLNALATEYLACMDIVEGDSCQAAVDYLKLNTQSLYDFADYPPTYSIVVCCFILLGVFVLVVIDIHFVRLAYAFDRDLWNIYLEDQGQYREIVNAIREEADEVTTESAETSVEIEVDS